MMAEPEIRYARTSDGVSIAHYAMGEGETLVIVPTVLWSNLRYPATPREFHRGGAGVGRGMRVVRYDGRGTGMSDRSALDFSLAARLRDLDAIVEKAAPRGFAMFATALGALAAVAYAARHPDRVTRLILHAPMVDGAVYRERVRRWDSLRAMAADEWQEYTLTMAAAVIGYKDPVRLERLATRYRESMEPAALLAHAASIAELDVSGLLPSLRMPVLVMYREGAHPNLTGDQVRAIASAIPDCQLVHTRGELGDLWSPEDTAAVERFLGVAPPAHARADAGKGAAPPAGTAIILFADIVDSTALTERIGDTAFREKARVLDDALRGVITGAGGTPIDGKLLGDGVLATFPAASQAIDAALACGRAGDEQGLPLHLGLHAGDVIREANNVFGGAVNIASRVSGLSAPGEVLVSATVRELARTSAGVTFEDRGEQALKGVADAVHVFAVRRG